MKYIIDSNILITAWNDTYPIDYFESVWEWIKLKIMDGEIVICESVYEEIKFPRDDLFNWLDDALKAASICPEPNSLTAVINSYSLAMNKARSNPIYTASALSEFASNADGWIIAHAKANGYVLVTEERSNIDSKKRVMIPDICTPLGVKCINTIGLFRDLGFKM